jgi:hypothetical protein
MASSQPDQPQSCSCTHLLHNSVCFCIRLLVIFSRLVQLDVLWVGRSREGCKAHSQLLCLGTQVLGNPAVQPLSL